MIAALAETLAADAPVDRASAELALGYAASTAMLIYTGLGLPMQVVENVRRRSTHGLSRSMFALSFTAFVLFAAYGAVKDPVDWFLVVSNVPGALLTGTILVQFQVYRDAGPRPDAR